MVKAHGCDPWYEGSIPSVHPINLTGGRSMFFLGTVGLILMFVISFVLMMEYLVDKVSYPKLMLTVALIGCLTGGAWVGYYASITDVTYLEYVPLKVNNSIRITMNECTVVNWGADICVTKTESFTDGLNLFIFSKMVEANTRQVKSKQNDKL